MLNSGREVNHATLLSPVHQENNIARTLCNGYWAIQHYRECTTSAKARSKAAMTIKKVPEAFLTCCSSRSFVVREHLGAPVCNSSMGSELWPKSVSAQAGLSAIGEPDDRPHQA